MCIDDDGRIAGYGVQNKVLKAFVMTPKAPPR
jgi:hypothetical protein